MLAEPGYEHTAEQRRRGVRSLLSVPILGGDSIIGVFSLLRTEVRPFTNKEIELLETFADQAAIAIENARLLTELQTKNADLTDALERQTATGEILRVISSSPTDVQPVFATIVRSAVGRRRLRVPLRPDCHSRGICRRGQPPGLPDRG